MIITAAAAFAGSILGYGIMWGTTKSEIRQHSKEISEMSEAHLQLSQAFQQCQLSGTKIHAQTASAINSLVEASHSAIDERQEIRTQIAEHREDVVTRLSRIEAKVTNDGSR
jgi:serine phosphatase RsbU (regulator of sigma subunit)